MTLDELRYSLRNEHPPTTLSPALEALWHAAKDDWDAAHRLAQEDDSPNGAWVHAYLHRMEGDQANASYWYARAGRPLPASTLEEEWTDIASALLAAGVP